MRSRSTGGAFAPFDPLSPLSEAGLADVPQLTATAMETASYRDAEVAGTTSALRATRFPLLNVAGRVHRRLAIAAGFTTYLDRTWDVTLRDSSVLRGTLERYTDEVTSDGSIADVRLAAASRLSRRIALGAGLHLLAGSTRETAERRFDDTSFHTVQQLAEVRYSGVGVSGSLLLGVAPGLSVGPRGQPAARHGGRHDERRHRPAAHGGRRDAVFAQPECAVRGRGGVARLGARRCRCV